MSAVPAAPPSAAPPLAPLSTRLLFAFDWAGLDGAETAKLSALAGEIRQAAPERIDAVGHADRIGAEAYNLKLSARRAEAVKAYLVSLGIDADVVHTSAKGEAEPASGDDCMDMGPENRQNRALIECLQADRRVAVTILPGRYRASSRGAESRSALYFGQARGAHRGHGVVGLLAVGHGVHQAGLRVLHRHELFHAHRGGELLSRDERTWVGRLHDAQERRIAPEIGRADGTGVVMLGL